MNLSSPFRAVFLTAVISFSSSSVADTLSMASETPENNVSRLPERGITMNKVEAQFGSPQRVIGPVGDPPITRWLYNDFTVYFEGEYVIHPVIRTNHTGWPIQ